MLQMTALNPPLTTPQEEGQDETQLVLCAFKNSALVLGEFEMTSQMLITCLINFERVS